MIIIVQHQGNWLSHGQKEWKWKVLKVNVLEPNWRVFRAKVGPFFLFQGRPIWPKTVHLRSIRPPSLTRLDRPLWYKTVKFLSFGPSNLTTLDRSLQIWLIWIKRFLVEKFFLVSWLLNLSLDQLLYQCWSYVLQSFSRWAFNREEKI